MVIVLETEEQISFVCGLILMYQLMKRITGVSVLSEREQKVIDELMDMVDKDSRYYADLQMDALKKEIEHQLNGWR